MRQRPASGVGAGGLEDAAHGAGELLRAVRGEDEAAHARLACGVLAARHRYGFDAMVVLGAADGAGPRRVRTRTEVSRRVPAVRVREGVSDRLWRRDAALEGCRPIVAADVEAADCDRGRRRARRW